MGGECPTRIRDALRCGLQDPTLRSVTLQMRSNLGVLAQISARRSLPSKDRPHLLRVDLLWCDTVHQHLGSAHAECKIHIYLTRQLRCRCTSYRSLPG